MQIWPCDAGVDVIGWYLFLCFFFFFFGFCLSPDFDSEIPWTRGHSNSAVGHRYSGDSVLVTGKVSWICPTEPFNRSIFRNNNHLYKIWYKFEEKLPLWPPLRRSHMWTVESSDPARRMRPDLDTPMHVRLELAVGGRYTCTCWSERMSNRRAVLSSDPDTKQFPVGWNCK